MATLQEALRPVVADYMASEPVRASIQRATDYVFQLMDAPGFAKVRASLETVTTIVFFARLEEIKCRTTGA